MKILVYCCRIALLSIILISCSKESIIDTSKSGSARVGSDIVRYDPFIEKLAKTLAKSLRKTEVRKFIKNEALKKFDGDYDILFSNIINQNINSKKVKDLFREMDNNTFDSDEIINKIPLINIAVPVGIEKWREESFTPVVVAFPDIQDESKLDRVKAYNSEGKEIWLNTKDLPDEPIVVVGLNERMTLDQNGKVIKRKDLIAINRTGDGPTTNLLPGEDPGSGGTGNSGCTYTDGQYLYAKWFASDKIDRWESRLKGLPEITMRVYAPSSSTNFSSLGEIRRVDEMEEPAIRLDGTFPWSDDAWFGSLTNLPSGTSIVSWTNSIFSKTLLFNFVEIDGGTSPVNVTIGGSFKVNIPGVGEATRNLSVTFDIANNDDNIGQLIVDQCQAPPQSGNSLTNGQPFYDVNTNFFVVLGN